MISIKEEPEMLESDLAAGPTARSDVRRGWASNKAMRTFMKRSR